MHHGFGDVIQINWRLHVQCVWFFFMHWAMILDFYDFERFYALNLALFGCYI